METEEVGSQKGGELAVPTLVAHRMQEWGMDKAPRRLRASVQKVLCELRPEALLYLKDSKFEVKIIHKRRQR